MKKKNKKTKIKKNKIKREKRKQFEKEHFLVKRTSWTIFLELLGIILLLALFEKAGKGGKEISKLLDFLFGKTKIFLPILLLESGIFLLLKKDYQIKKALFFGNLFIFLGILGIATIKSPPIFYGGRVGFLLSWFFYQYFGKIVTFLIFLAIFILGLIFFKEIFPKKEKKVSLEKLKQKSPPLLKLEQLKKEISFQKRELKKEPEIEKEIVDEKPAYLLNKILKNYPSFPPLLFDCQKELPASGDINYNSKIIKKTLQNFGISVEMGEVNIGPAVTQYTLKPAEGIKLSKILSLKNDLALALASHPIRIEAPIPGKSLVGIEVPNRQRAVVKLGELITSKFFKETPSRLTICLGKDVAGNFVFTDLEKMPHLLVAGSTGSGKTICLESIILSLIVKNPPELLKLILIDPKRVEFTLFNSLSHLLTDVLHTPKKTIFAIQWLIAEMERRFELLSKSRKRDIRAYNNSLTKTLIKKEGLEIMPYIILIIDELADLMAAKGKELEAGIVRLAQMARAVGIHLVLATQRPSVEVITGLIKANITSRIAFQVPSQIDSRTILDCSGAETLLGRGDMLFLGPGFSKPKRIQGCFVSQKEVKDVVAFIEKKIKTTKEKIPLEERFEQALEKSISEDFDLSQSEKDPLYPQAKELVINYQKASASLLQRRLKIGYARAARILDMLEEDGIVGPPEGAKPRKVLIQKDENTNFQDYAG